MHVHRETAQLEETKQIDQLSFMCNFNQGSAAKTWGRA